jgi:molybdate transport system substrate-binding protein
MRIRTVLTAGAALLALAGCGAPDAAPGTAGGTSPAVTGPVTVFAAASLTETFTALGKIYEARYPGSSVTFNFGGSSALAAQLNQGAPADVFAAAAPKNMADVPDAVAPATFARNQLVIAVPKGRTGVSGPADLARPGVKVALCAEQVPCGAAAKKVLTGIPVTPVTLEQDVKAALAKVRLGEVDAALVYRTDARAAAAEVDAIEFAQSAAAVNDYPVAVLADAPHPAGARAFVALVRSPEGLAVLTAAGFQAP